jgi:hypothetical protein
MWCPFFSHIFLVTLCLSSFIISAVNCVFSKFYGKKNHSKPTIVTISQKHYPKERKSLLKIFRENNVFFDMSLVIMQR